MIYSLFLNQDSCRKKRQAQTALRMDFLSQSEDYRVSLQRFFLRIVDRVVLPHVEDLRPQHILSAVGLPFAQTFIQHILLIWQYDPEQTSALGTIIKLPFLRESVGSLADQPRAIMLISKP